MRKRQAHNRPKGPIRPAVVLVIAALAAYLGSFNGVFVYDDLDSIVDNPHIRRLWPLSEAFSLPLWGTGLTVDGRPVLSLSFALNHALFGPEPWGYHLVNLLIHICAGLLLFGVVRRTIRCSVFGVQCSGGDGAEKTGGPAPTSMLDVRCSMFDVRSPTGHTAIALSVALLWLLHPLHTGAVTYIVQRSESMMGMFYLLTVYCAIRGLAGERSDRSDMSDGSDSSDNPLGPVAWYGASLLALALSFGTKISAATAPALIGLYDVVFVSGSIREALRRRWRYYAALAATSLVLIWILLPEAELPSATPLKYAWAQPGAILHYLRLSVWPRPLVMHYGLSSPAGVTQILLAGVVIGTLLVLTFRGIIRRRWYGFAGAWFFLALAPTSSFVPLHQDVSEHRMYLPLAAVITAGVLAAVRILNRAFPSTDRQKIRSRAAAACLIMAVAVYGSITHTRNLDYHSRRRLWSENLRHQPRSFAAHVGLGCVLDDAGQSEDAIAHYIEAARLAPGYARTSYNWGNALTRLNRHAEAEHRYRQAIELKPRFAMAHNNLGVVLRKQKRFPQAEACFRKAVAIDPGYARALSNLGIVLHAQGKTPEAVTHLHKAVGIDPKNVSTRNNLGVALATLGRMDEAIAEFRTALAMDPDNESAKENLASALQQR